MRKIVLILAVFLTALSVQAGVFLRVGVGYALASFSPFAGQIYPHGSMIASFEFSGIGGAILYSPGYGLVEGANLRMNMGPFAFVYDFSGFSHELVALGYSFKLGPVKLSTGGGYDLMGGDVALFIGSDLSIGDLRISAEVFPFLNASLVWGGRISYTFWDFPVTFGFKSSAASSYYYLEMGYELEELVPISVDVLGGKYGTNFFVGDTVRISLKTSKRYEGKSVRVLLVGGNEEEELGRFDLAEQEATFRKRLARPGVYKIKLIPDGKFKVGYKSPEIVAHEIPKVSFNFGRYIGIGEKAVVTFRASDGEKYIITVQDGPRTVVKDKEVVLRDGRATVELPIDTSTPRETEIKISVYGKSRWRREVKIGAEVRYRIAAVKHAFKGENVKINLEKLSSKVEPFEDDYVTVEVGGKRVGSIKVNEPRKEFDVSFDRIGKYGISLIPSADFEVNAIGEKSITVHEMPKVLLRLPEGFIGIGQNVRAELVLSAPVKDVYYVGIVDESGNIVFRGTVESNEPVGYEIDTSRAAIKRYRVVVYGRELAEGKVMVGGEARYYVKSTKTGDVFQDDMISLMFTEEDLPEFLKGEKVEVFLKNRDGLELKVGEFETGSGKEVLRFVPEDVGAVYGEYELVLKAPSGIKLTYNEISYRIHEVPKVLMRFENAEKGVARLGKPVYLKVKLTGTHWERSYRVKLKGDGIEKEFLMNVNQTRRFKVDTKSVGRKTFELSIYGRDFGKATVDVTDAYKIRVLNTDIWFRVVKGEGISTLDLYRNPLRIKVENSIGEPVAGFKIEYEALYMRLLESPNSVEDYRERGEVITDANGEAVLNIPLYPSRVKIRLSPGDPFVSLRAPEGEGMASAGKSVEFVMALISSVEKVRVKEGEGMVEVGKTLYLYGGNSYKLPIARIDPGNYYSHLRKNLMNDRKWNEYKDSVIRKFFQDIFLEIEPKVFEGGKFRDAEGVKINREQDLTYDELMMTFSFSETPKPIYLIFTVRDKRGVTLYKDFVRLVYIGSPSIRTLKASLRHGGYSEIVAEVKSDFGPIPHIGVKLTVEGERFGKVTLESITDRNGRASFVAPPIPFDDYVTLKYSLFVPGGRDLPIKSEDTRRVLPGSGNRKVEVILPRFIDVQWSGKSSEGVAVDIQDVLKNVEVLYNGVRFISIREISGYDLYKLLSDLRRIVYSDDGNSREVRARIFLSEKGEEAVVAVYGARGDIEGRGMEKLLGVFKVQDGQEISFRMPNGYKRLYFIAVNKDYVPERWDYEIGDEPEVQLSKKGIRIPVELEVKVHRRRWKNTLSYSVYIRGDFYGMAFRGIDNSIVLSKDDVNKLLERMMKNVIAYSIDGVSFKNFSFVARKIPKEKEQVKGSLAFKVDLKDRVIRMRNDVAGRRFLFLRSVEERLEEVGGIGILKDTWYGIPLYSKMFKDSDDLNMGSGVFHAVAYYPNGDVLLRKDIKIDLKEKEMEDEFSGNINAASLKVSFQGIKESFIGNLVDKSNMIYRIVVDDDEGVEISGKMDETVVSKKLLLTPGLHKLTFRVDKFFEDHEILVKITDVKKLPSEIESVVRDKKVRWSLEGKTGDVTIMFSNGVSSKGGKILVAMKPRFTTFTVRFKTSGYLALIPSFHAETGFVRLRKEYAEMLGLELPSEDYEGGYLKNSYVLSAYIGETRDAVKRIRVKEDDIVTFFVFNPVVEIAPLFMCVGNEYLPRSIEPPISGTVFDEIEYHGKKLSDLGSSYPFRILLRELKIKKEKERRSAIKELEKIRITVWGEIETIENGKKVVYRMVFNRPKSPCDVELFKYLDVNTDTWLSEKIDFYPGVNYYIKYPGGKKRFLIKDERDLEDMIRKGWVKKRSIGGEVYYELDLAVYELK